MNNIVKRVILFACYLGIMMIGMKLSQVIVDNGFTIGSITITYYMIGFIVSTILGILIYTGKEE